VSRMRESWIRTVRRAVILVQAHLLVQVPIADVADAAGADAAGDDVEKADAADVVSGQLGGSSMDLESVTEPVQDDEDDGDTTESQDDDRPSGVEGSTVEFEAAVAGTGGIDDVDILLKESGMTALEKAQVEAAQAAVRLVAARKVADQAKADKLVAERMAAEQAETEISDAETLRAAELEEQAADAESERRNNEAVEFIGGLDSEMRHMMKEGRWPRAAELHAEITIRMAEVKEDLARQALVAAQADAAMDAIGEAEEEEEQ
jgi:hypothetical protein